MGLTAIIGGSGFDTYDAMAVTDAIFQDTPYGNHSGPVLKGSLSNTACLFLPRHGEGHKLPPHKVNYRANIWLLKELGVSNIIACSVVGGISPVMKPNTIVIPEQLIDYTYGREHTFYDGAERSGMVEQFQHVEHIDFSAPYARDLREKIIRFLYKADIDCVGHGVYGCTQGPRLETAAEIERLKRDGCDVVGMTAMPEAALAKEVGIDYAAVAVVVNWAAGVATQPLSMLDIMNTVRENMGKVKGILPELLPFL